MAAKYFKIKIKKGVTLLKVILNVHPNIEEEKIEIWVKEMTPNIDQIVKLVHSQEEMNIITVMKEDRSYILNLDQISHLYVENKTCYLVAGQEKYIYKHSLKYFEENSPSSHFIRISKNCIANIKWIHYFEVGFSGQLVLKFKNNWKEYVSRKYVKELKRRLN